MNFIYKGLVFFGFTAIIVTETSVDKNINDIPKTNKLFALKSLNKQGQNIFCTNPFEALFTTIPVVVLSLKSIKKMIVFLYPAVPSNTSEPYLALLAISGGRFDQSCH